ncbi:hypothetical protein BDW66DRAFT_158692 [Aspergillus desertorum]
MATNGSSSSEATPVVSTLPGPDHNWQVTLAGKVIAITGANQGIGLGLAEVVLANSAAHHQLALDFTMDQVKRLFELNVFGAWNCATAAAKTFIKLGIKGSIVFTASMTSYRPNRAVPSAPYGGTKAAVRNMTHTLAMEWAKHGIRVNSISPGFVKTALTYYELGGAYVYLLSDTATYTTGIDIPVAGIVGAW